MSGSERCDAGSLLTCDGTLRSALPAVPAAIAATEAR
jgi:hypothetical protein